MERLFVCFDYPSFDPRDGEEVVGPVGRVYFRRYVVCRIFGRGPFARPGFVVGAPGSRVVAARAKVPPGAVGGYAVNSRFNSARDELMKRFGAVKRVTNGTSVRGNNFGTATLRCVGGLEDRCPNLPDGYQAEFGGGLGVEVAKFWSLGRAGRILYVMPFADRRVSTSRVRPLCL